jgi:hypothetical protein
LLPAASFCRQCGSPGALDTSTAGSEQPTALFGKTPENVTTQRLDPRLTSPDRGATRLSQHASPLANNSSTRAKSPRQSLIGGVILLLIVGIVSAVAVVKMRSRAEVVGRSSQAAAGNATLLYPGAQTIVNMTNTDGSRTIQLETSDQLDRVESWYQTNLKLTKTVRLTSASVVMKNEKVTISLANENNKTVVLIKQAP